LEGYFESLAEQGFQNNLFFRSSTKKWELALPSGALTFQVVWRIRRQKARGKSLFQLALSFLSCVNLVS